MSKLDKNLESVLLIGGRFDGTWREVQKDEQVIELNWSDPAPIEVQLTNPDVSNFKVEQVLYRRIVWGFGMAADGVTPEIRSFFVHELTAAQIVDRLMESYKPKRFAELEEQLRKMQRIVRELGDQVEMCRKSHRHQM